MEHTIENQTDALKYVIQMRCFAISDEIASVVSDLDRVDGCIERFARLKQPIIDLVNLASFNYKFYDDIKSVYEPFISRRWNRENGVGSRQVHRRSMELVKVWRAIVRALSAHDIIKL